jgi:hypothetical protein
VIFVGDGAKAKDILKLPNAEFREDIYPSAQYLIKKTLEKIKKEFEDMAYFEPFYLKDFHGVKKKFINNLKIIKKRRDHLRFLFYCFCGIRNICF